MLVRSAEEHLTRLKTIRTLHLQLADAIYCDHDRFIRERFNERETAKSWNWPADQPKT